MCTPAPYRNFVFLCRFSQLRDFSLCHWTKNVTYAVDVSHRLCQYFPFCSSKFMSPLNKNIHFTFFVLVIFFSFLSWWLLGFGTVMSPPSLPHPLLLYRPVSKCLQNPRTAQPVFAEHKSPVLRGIWKTSSLNTSCGKCDSRRFKDFFLVDGFILKHSY